MSSMDDLAGLLDEQAALRRIAVLVASGTERDTASGRVHLTGRPSRIDDFGGPGTVNAVLREMGLRAAIAAPVSVEGALWGSVVVGTTSETAFPPDAESRVAALAELVALALANVRYASASHASVSARREDGSVLRSEEH